MQLESTEAGGGGRPCPAPRTLWSAHLVSRLGGFGTWRAGGMPGMMLMVRRERGSTVSNELAELKHFIIIAAVLKDVQYAQQI